jgi:thiamine-phosphate pyrophosphorylase
MELQGLYVIVDPEQTRGRDPVAIANAAIRGGAGIIQYRDKLHDKGDQLPVIERLLALCRRARVPLLVNDHADLALAVGADGVHVGQHDLPPAVVRRLLGPAAIVGCSTNNAVGRLFPTQSKSNTRPATLDTLGSVRAAVALPVVGIGGITAANVEQVIEAGADAAAVIAAVCAADDVEAAARAISSRFAHAGARR